MRVSVHPGGQDGCGYFRLIFVARELQRQGCDVVLNDTIRALWRDRSDGSRECQGVVGFDADVAVFQRTFRPDMLAVQRTLQAQGVAVVQDIDDDLLAIDPRHPTYHVLHPRSGDVRSWEVLREACRTADLVTVSTPALARKYAGHGRVRVIRNHIPAAWLAVDVPRSSPPTVGWTGTPKTHVGDLETVREPLRTVLQQSDWRFRAIGSAETLRVLGIDGEVVPWVPLDGPEYPRTVGSLDLGIVPLRRSAFTEAKSWLKGLEYAALGVPFVASPTPEYVALHELGAGWLAERPREWVTALRLLMKSPDHRATLIDHGREAVANLTIEEQMAPHVWEAWNAALENRHARAA